jgi:hypothetical protein
MTCPMADDVFADLSEERHVSEKTVRILEYTKQILAAHDRGVPWGKIAARLTDIGVPVSGEYLRCLMDRYGDKSASKGTGRQPKLVARKRKTPSNQPTVKPKPSETEAADRPELNQDLTTALVTLDILEQMKDVKADEPQPPAENAPPAEPEHPTTKPPSPKSEWLTNKDLEDL